MNLTKELKLAYIQNQDFLLTAIQADKMLIKKETTIEDIIPVLNSLNSQGLKNVFLNREKYLTKVKESTNETLKALAKKSDFYRVGAYIFFSQTFITEIVIYFLEKRNFEVMNAFCKSLYAQYDNSKEEYFVLDHKIVNYFNSILLNDPKKPTNKSQFNYAMRTLSNLCDLKYYYHNEDEESTLNINNFLSLKPFIDNNMCLEIAKRCSSHLAVMDHFGYANSYFFKKIKELAGLTEYVKACLKSFDYSFNFVVNEIEKCGLFLDVQEAIQFLFKKYNFWSDNFPLLLRLLTIYISANGNISVLIDGSKTGKLTIKELSNLVDAVNAKKAKLK